MLKHLTTFFAGLAALTCLSVQTARAQHAEDFCASSPVDMLAALDGAWTLRQGAGVALGGLAVPLPALPPQAMQLSYDSATTTATLSGAGGTLLLMPTSAQQVTHILSDLTEDESQELLNIDGGCDWYALPVMLGSNTYRLSEGARRPEDNMFVAIFQGRMIVYCTTGMDPDGAFPGPYVHIAIVPEEDDEGEPFDGVGQTYSDESCRAPAPTVAPPRQGQMVMSMIVRFQSPNHGSGMLHFEGRMNGRAFAAKAPVTLTR